MNEYWLNGKHPAIHEAPKESKKGVEDDEAKDRPLSANAGWAWGWGLYWFAVLFLAYTLSDAFFVFGFFGGIAKWIFQRNKNAAQIQTDKLYGKMQRESDPLSAHCARDWETDTLNNPAYMGFPGNVANIGEDDFPNHQC